MFLHYYLFIPRKGEEGGGGGKGRGGGPDKDTVTHFERHGKTPTGLGKGMSCKGGGDLHRNWLRLCSGIQLRIPEAGHMPEVAVVPKSAITTS